MPELPEIETVRRVVAPQIMDSEIESVSVNKDKIVGFPQKQEFVDELTGRRFVSHDRKGKGLILGLDDGSRLVIRFGMTGQLIVVPPDYPPEKHTHVDIELTDGRHLWYIDSRMFGKVWYIPSGTEDTYTGLYKLGIEPFDASLSGPFLKDSLGRRHITIKEALLDQSVVAGIGNIWSDEILFRSRICPETPCSKLCMCDWEKLSAVIPEVMEFGIEKNAISPEEYLEGKGRKYYDIYYLEAYGHEGDPCTRCGTSLVRSVLGGRSSYWCPGCQKRR